MCLTQSRPICPPACSEFLGEDEGGWHTEYLTTTSLFLNMRGLDLIDTRDRNALQLVVRTAQETFDRYEGTLTGILADDKALTLLGVFGLPPLVHEEDALRAVEAGQALDRALLDIRLDHGIGITTGRVFTGLYGTDVFRACTVVGPSVNLAARLMQAAGNEVLCDRATRRATRGRVHFAQLTPIRLKGHDVPVEAYRPIWSVQPGANATDPLVGRDEEQAIVHRRLGAAARGEPVVLVLEGEAGIGKTRPCGRGDRHQSLARIHRSGRRGSSGGSRSVFRMANRLRRGPRPRHHRRPGREGPGAWSAFRRNPGWTGSVPASRRRDGDRHPGHGGDGSAHAGGAPLAYRHRRGGTAQVARRGPLFS